MRYLASFLLDLTKFLRSACNQKVFIGSTFIFIILCPLSLLGCGTSRANEVTKHTNAFPTIPHTATTTITPTKWWIKTTATSTSLIVTVPTASDRPNAGNCSNVSSSPPRTETFAYIALDPPVPNRMRAGASLSSVYLGQLEPGAGLKVIDGPVCADGYSWWLVESLDKRLRGWTVEGKDSEQWLKPCPNVNEQCSFLATPTPPRVNPQDENPENMNENLCKADKLSTGMLAHVDQDSLIVVRTEPSIGAVVGHAGPMSLVKILGGPNCVGGTIWWKINVLDLGIIGWTTENYLEPCSKDNECNE